MVRNRIASAVLSPWIPKGLNAILKREVLKPKSWDIRFPISGWSFELKHTVDRNGSKNRDANENNTGDVGNWIKVVLWGVTYGEYRIICVIWDKWPKIPDYGSLGRVSRASRATNSVLKWTNCRRWNLNCLEYFQINQNLAEGQLSMTKTASPKTRVVTLKPQPRVVILNQ